MTVTAITTLIPTFLDLEDDAFVGPFSLIWSIMQTKFNFSVKINGYINYGQLYSNKDGSGIFGSLIRNETQFSVVPMYLTEKGVLWLDYTSILIREEWNFISGPPRILFPDYFATLRSFENSVWKMLCIALFLYALFWTVITQCLKKNASRLDFAKAFGDYLFSSVVVLVNQYRYATSARMYERICWIAWRIPCMLLSLSFTGMLFAKLNKQDEPFRYETLKDVLRDPEIKILLMENTPPYHEIKNSVDQVTMKIWEKVNQEGTVSKIEEIDYFLSYAEMMQGELVVLILKRAFLGLCTKICGSISEIHVSKLPYSATMFTLFMRSDLDLKYRKTIKFVASQILESQILEVKLDLLDSMGRMCNVEMTPDLSPLELNALYFIFIFYCFTTILAVCVFVVELIASPSQLKSTRRKHAEISLDN